MKPPLAPLKRPRLAVALALLLLQGLDSGCSTGSEDPNRFDYVALGDSVAFGIGGTDDVGYARHLADYLGTVQARRVELDRQALPLERTGELLVQLRDDLPRGVRAAVRRAELLTVSIGGNNLLRCATDNYDALDEGCAAEGVEDFRNDWPRILDQVRQDIGAAAPLIVLTLYNPFQGDDPQFARADTYIRQVNQIIADPATRAAYNYKVADAYARFAGQLPDGSWKTCAWTHFCEAERDPHPTDAGHQQLAALHQPLYP